MKGWPWGGRDSLRGQVLLGLVVGVAAWLFHLGPAGRGLENKFLDLLFLLRGALPAGDNLVIVAVDDQSFSDLGLQWPWPRSLHARLTERLHAARARVIGFDILFSEPSPPDQDAALAEAFARAGNVVLGSDLRIVEAAAYRQTLRVAPLPALERAASGVGVVNQIQDQDGTIRKARLGIGGAPSFAYLVARVSGWRGPPGEAPFLINYRGPSPAFRTISYSQALDPKAVPDDVFRDKIVLIGRAAGAPGRPVDDAHYSPYFWLGRRLTPGVEIHASILDTVLHERPIRPVGQAARVGWALGWGLAGAVVAGRVGPWVGLGITLGLLVLQGGIALGSFAGAEVWIPWGSPVLATGAGYGATVAVRWRRTEREKAFIQGAFQRYLHPSVVRQIIEQPGTLRLGGESVEATVCFADLEEFTRIVEKLTPEELVALLNSVLAAMIEVILAHRGMLNQVLGDGILAIWNVPVPSPHHALDACRAAIAMQERLAQLNLERAEHGSPPLKMRIGIQTGQVVAGNIGSPELFHYGVVGDTVNLASRLEQINKLYGTRIILGEDTARQARDVLVLRELDLIRVVGRVEPVRIYECVGARAAVPADTVRALTAFEDGLQAYQRGEWRQALADLERAAALAPSDGPTRVFLERSRHFLAESPPSDWDGVYTARSKSG